MGKVMNWLRSYDFIPKKEEKEKKEKKPFNPAPILIGVGVAGLCAATGYSAYKYGRKRENTQLKKDILSHYVWDVPASLNDENGQPAVVTIFGMVADNEDEYVSNRKIWYKNRRCSDEFIEEREKSDRDNWNRRFADYMNQ